MHRHSWPLFAIHKPQASCGPWHPDAAPMRRHGPSGNAVVTVAARVSRTLGAPRPQSADGRRDAGFARVYTPRCPQASPLFRLVSDHLHRLQTFYDERFTRAYGPWRPVVGQVADKFQARGVSTASRASAVTPVRTKTCWRSRASLPVLLPQLSRQAACDLDAAAGDDAPRARCRTCRASDSLRRWARTVALGNRRDSTSTVHPEPLM